MIVAKTNGELITKVTIVVVERDKLVVWVEGAETPIELKLNEISSFS